MPLDVSLLQMFIYLFLVGSDGSLPIAKVFLVAQTVKNLPAMRKTQVQSLDQEDTLEMGMETHSRILAWRIPWTEEPGTL